MSNMSYCRFENTSSDLMDCHQNLLGKLSEDEERARFRLVRTCVRILYELDLLKEPIEEGAIKQALIDASGMEGEEERDDD